MDEGLSIQEAADRVGLSIDTLRYYERAGLLNHILRTTGRQRRYDAASLGAIGFVMKMRATGMPIRKIREYMDATVTADGFSTDRRAILVEHRRAMLERMDELTEAVALIDKKIEMFDSSGLGCGPQAAEPPLLETATI